MSKYAPDFPLIENEAYDTPPDAVLPLLPHLPTGFDFVEICAGAGQLVDALEKGGAIASWRSTRHRVVSVSSAEMRSP
jgi:hypothetical protein